MKATGIYVVQALSGVAALAAACASLAGVDLMVQQFEVIGLGSPFRLVAGSVELVAGLALIIPRTGALGGAILACLMVAAAGATLGHLAALRPLSEGGSVGVFQTYQDLIARERSAPALPRGSGARNI
jgi:hypothetical protein